MDKSHVCFESERIYSRQRIPAYTVQSVTDQAGESNTEVADIEMEMAGLYVNLYLYADVTKRNVPVPRSSILESVAGWQQ